MNILCSSKSVQIQKLLTTLEDISDKIKALTADIYRWKQDEDKLTKDRITKRHESGVRPRHNPRKTILLDDTPSTSIPVERTSKRPRRAEVVEIDLEDSESPSSSEDTPLKRAKRSQASEIDLDSSNFKIVEGYVMVYTSGVCNEGDKSNAKAGFGVWFDRGTMNISHPVIGRPSKIIADIQALVVALLTLKKHKVKMAMLHTSLATTSMKSRINYWKQNWKTLSNRDDANKDLIAKLEACLEEFDDIQWIHVKESEADILAEDGAAFYEEGKTGSLCNISGMYSWEDKINFMLRTEESKLKKSKSKAASSVGLSNFLCKPVDKPSNISERVSDETDSEDVNFQKDGDYVVVYTDGACENNGRANAKAGIGVWFGDSHPLNISEPVVGRPTNNTAEIRACLAALEVLHRYRIKKVSLHTDSMFIINSMTLWIHNWKANGWKTSKGDAVKNKTDFMKLDEIIKRFDDLRWVHVKGHHGVRGNEEADKLARNGAARYKP
ncbi:unnamed protein product [Acanthoscelides obtectus]|uniref:RNase H type-1 domain-containing protein n=1 Tax=Acanthoscelides obtectus TaxID=200917 RepID=A0A9P0KXC1_ACAOB|nr:unnamed protein product [Acanthoscelides obtectus]CAK1681868.1 Ribonuclease H1 [Acanthoscelides obtectus]